MSNFTFNTNMSLANIPERCFPRSNVLIRRGQQALREIPKTYRTQMLGAILQKISPKLGKQFPLDTIPEELRQEFPSTEVLINQAIGQSQKKLKPNPPDKNSRVSELVSALMETLGRCLSTEDVPDMTNHIEFLIIAAIQEIDKIDIAKVTAKQTYQEVFHPQDSSSNSA